MSEAQTVKHTPGPWRETALGYEIWAGNVRVATVNAFPMIDAPYGDDVIDANARLIAAAPELLEALLALVADYTWSKRSLDEVYAQEHPVMAARAAIARATGGAA